MPLVAEADAGAATGFPSSFSFDADNGLTVTGTWTVWNHQYYITAENSTVTNDYVWGTWTTLGGNTEPESASYAHTSYAENNLIWITWNTSVVETQEQFEARLARDQEAREQYAREAEQRKAEAKIANERAEMLLRDFLTAEQLSQLIKSDYFEMVTGSGRRYRVTRGRAGNVYLVEKEKLVCKYCIHPDEFVSDADTMLAQKLLLETDENKFLKTANKTVLTR